MIRVISFIRKIYWFIFRPQSTGVKALVEKGGKILLIKNSYENQLMLPGGKVGKNETPEDAIKRELYEETGLVAKKIMPLGVYKNDQEYKKDTIHLFSVKDFDIKDDPKSKEIEGWDFYDKDKLPDKVSPATLRRIKDGGKSEVRDW